MVSLAYSSKEFQTLWFSVDLVYLAYRIDRLKYILSVKLHQPSKLWLLRTLDAIDSNIAGKLYLIILFQNKFLVRYNLFPYSAIELQYPEFEYSFFLTKLICGSHIVLRFPVLVLIFSWRLTILIIVEIWNLGFCHFVHLSLFLLGIWIHWS